MSTRLANAIFGVVVIAMIGSAVIAYTIGQTSANSANSGTAQAAENSNVINLPPGEKLVSGQVGSYGIWSYITRPMRPGETPETYTLTGRRDDNLILKDSSRTIREHADDEKK